MPSTPTPDEADPHDIFAIEPDVVFGLARGATDYGETTRRTGIAGHAAGQRGSGHHGDIRAGLPRRRDAWLPIFPLPCRCLQPCRRSTRRFAPPQLPPILSLATSRRPIPARRPIPSRCHPTSASTAPTYSSGSRWAKRAAVAFLFALSQRCRRRGLGSLRRYGNADDKADDGGLGARSALNSSQPAEKPPPENTVVSAPPASCRATGRARRASGDYGSDRIATGAFRDLARSGSAPGGRASNGAAAPSQPAQTQPTSPDIAAMGQQIEVLKATIAQLKAGQEQMATQISQQASHDTIRNAVARTSEARASISEPRPRLSSAAPHPAPALVRKPPRPAYLSAQASAALNRSPQPAPPIAAPTGCGYINAGSTADDCHRGR